MKAHIHRVIGAVMALTLPACTALADQMDVFDRACGTYHYNYNVHGQEVIAQGWQRDDAHPALANLVTGIKRNARIEQVRGYTHPSHTQPYVLTLSRGAGITACTVLAPNARNAVDETKFNARFDPFKTDPNRLLNDIRTVYYADATSPPVPRYKIIGDKRPKVERGLIGQRMTASYFTQSGGN